MTVRFFDLVGALNTLMGGVRVGAMASGVFILVTPVALAVGPEPLAGACLIALVCVAVGSSTRWPPFGGLYEVPLVHHATSDSLRYLVVMTVLVSESTYYVLAYARGHGVWLVLTLLMVLQVDSHATKRRALRVAGTMVAPLASALVASVATQQWVISTLVILAFLGVLATASLPKHCSWSPS